jgi:hypothetical protein
MIKRREFITLLALEIMSAFRELRSSAGFGARWLGRE